MSDSTSPKGGYKLSLEVVGGPHAGLKKEFEKAVVTIGRGVENDIALPNDPKVSRQHAEIRQRPGPEFVVVNLSQRNFIMINGHMVETEILTNDSAIFVGDSELRFKSEFLPEKALAPVIESPSFPQTLGPIAQSPRQMGPPISRPLPNPTPPPLGRKSTAAGSNNNSRARFYGVIGILVVGGFLLFSPSKKKAAKDPNAIRTPTMSMQDFVEAEKRSQELLNLKKEKYDSQQYRRAQENFVKGFRDFQQGQYMRAKDAFQVVLNLDPENELAKRYYSLSKIKFDELVKFNMIQGNRYREKKNWRMCQSNYSNVLTMLSYRKEDPTFKEAKQFYEECTLNLEGRF